MSYKLILNSLSGTILYLINIVVAFIMSPVIIKVLGNRDYGLWELLMSVIGYMGLLDLGIAPALVRFVSVADGKQDELDLQKTISTAFAFFVVVGCVAMMLFLALGFSSKMITGNEARDIANVDTVLILLGVNAGMFFPLQVFIATLMGVQRHLLINCTRGGLAIIRAVLTYYLLQRYPHNGLVAMALLEPVFTASQLMLFVGSVCYDKRLPRIAFSAITLAKLRELFTFGAKSAAIMIASRLQNQSVPLIIGNVIGLGHVVYFVIPNRLVDYAKGVSQTIGFPLVPYFGSSLGRGEQKELLKSWLNTTLALQVISLVMPLVIFFYGETFLALWLGKEYAIAGHWVIYSLLAGLVADSLATNAIRILTAQGLHGKCAVIWLVLSVLSIPLGIWGASIWSVVGVTLATTLVTVVGNLSAVLLACFAMQISLKTYFRETLLRLTLPVLMLTVALWTLTWLIPVNSYTDLLVQLFMAGSVYAVAVCRFTVNPDVRRQLRDKLRLWIVPQQ